jgi:glycosyltransferase involved in cell wall biosynthesis
MLARLRHPRRLIRIHWHAFLQPDASPLGLLMAMYQWIALRWAAIGVQTVVTTSPVLADVLEQEGVPPSRIRILPCCLGEEQESRARCLAEARRPEASAAPAATRSLRLLFIGRLDSYKRVDLLIEAFAQSRAGRLDLVGEGPRREDFQRLASSSGRGEQITFHGRLDEVRKQNLLQHADLLVLPADRSNEAFGIVQLEAMACGVPSLALDCPRSGVAWVGQLKPLLGFPRLGHRELAAAINRLIEEPDLLRQASESALRRYGEIFARSVWQARFSAMLS